MAKAGRPRQFDRDAALHAAMELFWEQGYESTSMAQLKQAMGGISAASLYAAFGSKEALFLEACQLYQSTLGCQLRNCLGNTDTPPLQALEQALRTAVTNLLDDRHPKGCMLVLSTTNCSKENLHLREAMSKERQISRNAFAACLQRAIDDGSLEPETDIAAQAAFFSTLLNGLSIQARDNLDAEMLDRVIDLALASLAPYPMISSPTTGKQHEH